jgi:uncharacterized membrane protein
MIAKWYEVNLIIKTGIIATTVFSVAVVIMRFLSVPFYHSQAFFLEFIFFTACLIMILLINYSNPPAKRV